MHAGVDGLLRDKIRPSRIPPLAPAVAERVVPLTMAGPPGDQGRPAPLPLDQGPGCDHRRYPARAPEIGVAPVAVAIGHVHYVVPPPKRMSTPICIVPSEAALCSSPRRTSSRTVRRASSGSAAYSAPQGPPPCSKGSK